MNRRPSDRARLLVGAAALALVLVSTAVARRGAESAPAPEPTLVFGTDADPVLLDGALAHDAESRRVINQIFEGLVGYRAGTTQLQPLLATSWRESRNGHAWTFRLRRGVRFHDSTPFDAAAVCFNFNRWWNLRPALQDPRVTPAWRLVFGGFHTIRPGVPGHSAYRGCRPVGLYAVRLLLNRRLDSLPGSLALSSFTIGSPRALSRFGANRGTVDANGVFHPLGSYGTLHPAGTGPFAFKSWSGGTKLELVRNIHYWGRKPTLRRLIFRPISTDASRRQALIDGEVQGYDPVTAVDARRLRLGGFKVLRRPAFDVAYLGINQAKPPFDRLTVRQALAYGLDRRLVVRRLFGRGAAVAREFMPPGLPGYTKSVRQYSYRPALARRLLRKAGLKLPVRVELWYPKTDALASLPQPKAVYKILSASLARAGFAVVGRTAGWPWRYQSAVAQGRCQLYLAAVTGGFADADAFLGALFRRQQRAWGPFRYHALYRQLVRALAEPSAARRAADYRRANEMIMRFLPGVPIAHVGSGTAFLRGVSGYRPSPVWLDRFASVRLRPAGNG